MFCAVATFMNDETSHFKRFLITKAYIHYIVYNVYMVSQVVGRKKEMVTHDSGRTDEGTDGHSRLL